MVVGSIFIFALGFLVGHRVGLISGLRKALGYTKDAIAAVDQRKST